MPADSVMTEPMPSVMDPVSLLGDRVIAFRPLLRSIGIARSVPGVLLASQLLWLYQQAGRQEFSASDLELSAQTALTVDEVRSARRDLRRQGVINSVVRGVPPTNHYDVDRERLAELMGRTQAGSQFGPPPDSIRASTRFNSGQDPIQFGPSPDLTLCKDLVEELDPLVFPREQVAAAEPAQAPDKVTPADPPPDTQPQDSPAATRSRRKPSAKPQAYQPSPDAIPAPLAGVERELLDFWAEKGGRRTERAWSGLLAHLERIRQAGGLEAVREQLEAGTQAGWQGITYANWQRFGPAAAKPAGTGYLSARERNDRELDRVVEFLQQQDQSRAAAHHLTTP